VKKDNLVFQAVRDAILEDTSRMAPGTRIPSRVVLMQRYSVTRTTIDRAISELIGSGHLYAQGGSGTYVSPSQEDQVRRKSRSWGVIIPSIEKQVGYRMVRGIEDVANEAGTHVVLCNSDDDIDKQSDYIVKLVDSGIDGLVIDPAMVGENDPRPFGLLKQRGIPAVYCNLNLRDMTEPSVIPNTFLGALLATQHLIDRGYERIAYLSIPAVYSSVQRYYGYATALAMNGLPLDPSLVVFDQRNQGANPGYDLALDLLRGATAPDAIFAFNDIYAASAYCAITDSGLAVGRDIGLVGYGNTDICTSFPVQLTSVEFGAYEVGAKAANLLNAILDGQGAGPAVPILVNPELITRHSSSGPA
jgi:LacI family transcriptional regulator